MVTLCSIDLFLDGFAKVLATSNCTELDICQLH